MNTNTARQIRTANDVGEAARRRAQAFTYAAAVEAGEVTRDVGAMWDADLQYRTERHDVVCTACGSPCANTHAFTCPKR